MTQIELNDPAQGDPIDQLMFPVLTRVPVIPVPEMVDGQYPDEVWEKVSASIAKADAQVLIFAAAKRRMDLLFSRATENRIAVQTSRDTMIIGDSRDCAAVGRLAGIGRARASQIRAKHRKAGGNAE